MAIYLIINAMTYEPRYLSPNNLSLPWIAIVYLIGGEMIIFF